MFKILITNSLDESLVLRKSHKKNIKWRDGDRADAWIPSRHAGAFDGFPYWLYFHEVFGLVWSENRDDGTREVSIEDFLS